MVVTMMNNLSSLDKKQTKSLTVSARILAEVLAVSAQNITVSIQYLLSLC